MERHIYIHHDAVGSLPGPLVGKRVRFQTPGPNGMMKQVGTVKGYLPDGRIELKAQQGGYYQMKPSEVEVLG